MSAPQRLPASRIEAELKSLIAIASDLEPNLAKRLDVIRRWIKDKKPGLLTRKKEVMDFLSELLLDTDFWLELKELSSEEKSELINNELTCSEIYWYDYLFSNWFNQYDKNFDRWRQKLMAEENSSSDKEFISALSDKLTNFGGNTLKRYILDFSMATDLVVSNAQNIPLCVQFTTLTQELSRTKKEDWEVTLCYWRITRALFLRYNSKDIDKNAGNLAQVILEKADTLPSHDYSEYKYNQKAD